jgi:hypothetical protein
MPNERHTYVIPGVVSEEKYREIGCKATLEDSELGFYVHHHKYNPVYRKDLTMRCNERCEIIRKGQVDKVQPTLVDSTAEQNGASNG